MYSTCTSLSHFISDIPNTEKIRKLFKKVVFSDPGSNERRKEENSYMMFVQYLEKCEDEGNIYNVINGYKPFDCCVFLFADLGVKSSTSTTYLVEDDDGTLIPATREHKKLFAV